MFEFWLLILNNCIGKMNLNSIIWNWITLLVWDWIPINLKLNVIWDWIQFLWNCIWSSLKIQLSIFIQFSQFKFSSSNSIWISECETHISVNQICVSLYCTVLSTDHFLPDSNNTKMSKVHTKQANFSVIGWKNQHKRLQVLPSSEEVKTEWMCFIFDGMSPQQLENSYLYIYGLRFGRAGYSHGIKWHHLISALRGTGKHTYIWSN